MGSSVMVARMQRELIMLAESPPPGVSAWAVDGSINMLEAVIQGPEDTPYSEGFFKLEINIPDSYPNDPPKVRFITPVYHPNIDNVGRICLDTLKMPPKGAWTPSLNIPTLLTTLRLLLSTPNPDDPLMPDITEEFIHNNKLFVSKAKKETKKHATNTVDETKTNIPITNNLPSASSDKTNEQKPPLPHSKITTTQPIKSNKQSHNKNPIEEKKEDEKEDDEKDDDEKDDGEKEDGEEDEQSESDDEELMMLAKKKNQILKSNLRVVEMHKESTTGDSDSDSGGERDNKGKAKNNMEEKKKNIQEQKKEEEKKAGPVKKSTPIVDSDDDLFLDSSPVKLVPPASTATITTSKQQKPTSSSSSSTPTSSTSTSTSTSTSISTSTSSTLKPSSSTLPKKPQTTKKTEIIVDSDDDDDFKTDNKRKGSPVISRNKKSKK